MRIGPGILYALFLLIGHTEQRFSRFTTILITYVYFGYEFLEAMVSNTMGVIIATVNLLMHNTHTHSIVRIVGVGV